MSTGRMTHRRFIDLLYFILRVLAFPLLVLYFLVRGYRDPRYFRGFMERLGSVPVIYKRTAPGSIWLHAVSVGEVISSVRLVEELRAANSAIPIYVSTTTLAGRAIASQKLAAQVNGIFYAPIDYAFAVRRVLRRIRPAVLVVLETEIWPMLYREVKRAGCGLMVVNGRISDRALPRYRRFQSIFRYALAFPDAIYVQSEEDRNRYVEIGASPEHVVVFGNLKYDAARVAPAPPEVVSQTLRNARPSPVWIAASTMPGADAADVDESGLVVEVFEALAAKYPQQLLILAPRKPELFQTVADLLRSRGISYLRRSELAGDSSLPLPGVLLLDTIGELAGVFSLGDAVFMGGTIARRGGHNILEPAFAARPIIIGPHMENFTAIAAEFRAAGAVLEIGGASELAGAIDRLLSDAALRSELGQRAERLAARNRGLTARAATLILEAQDAAVPAWNLYGFWKSLAGALSWLWLWGSEWKQGRDLARARSLPLPVVSVGGIAMGGSGKTPFADMLARRLHERALRPAILTRGYRRRSLADVLVLEAGEQALSSATGDEAQIFVRSGAAHVGIGSDRWLAGRTLLQHFPTDLFLLDDGYQHRRLHRDLDIVLIDALDPFAGGAVFPRGRLREPVTALSRASAFVIVRAQPGRRYSGIRKRLTALNAAAPIFTAGIRPRCWIHGKTRQECAQMPGPVAAFCALGNPDTFWTTLGELGLTTVFNWAFPDHHVYKPRELRRLAAQARARGCPALVTTQKDAMNLPPNFAAVVAPVEIYWLEVDAQVEGEDELLGLVESTLTAAQARK